MHSVYTEINRDVLSRTSVAGEILVSTPQPDFRRFHYTDGTAYEPKMRSLVEIYSEYSDLANRVWRGNRINELEWQRMSALEWVLNFQPIKP